MEGDFPSKSWNSDLVGEDVAANHRMREFNFVPQGLTKYSQDKGKEILQSSSDPQLVARCVSVHSS